MQDDKKLKRFQIVLPHKGGKGYIPPKPQSGVPVTSNLQQFIQGKRWN